MIIAMRDIFTSPYFIELMRRRYSHERSLMKPHSRRPNGAGRSRVSDLISASTSAALLIAVWRAMAALKLISPAAAAATVLAPSLLAVPVTRNLWTPHIRHLAYVTGARYYCWLLAAVMALSIRTINIQARRARRRSGNRLIVPCRWLIRR